MLLRDLPNDEGPLNGDGKPWRFELDNRVSRLLDSFKPEEGLKFGTVIKRSKSESYKVGEATYGPYPELYSIQWDNGLVEHCFFPFGLNAVINTDVTA